MSSEIIANLVRNSQQGNTQAFGELYEMFADDMYRFAWYYTGSPYYAQEAVSETVLSAFKSIGSLKKADSFKSWLFKILYNECKKVQKEKSFAMNTEEYSQRTDLQYITADPNDMIALRKALEKLSDEEREILVLHYSCGYTSREISDITGIKDATLRSKISRSTDKLRQLLSM